MKNWTLALTAFAASILSAQPAPPAGRGPQGPVVISPEVLPDQRVVFRINAPQAKAVRLNGSDIPGNLGPGAEMTKAENGVWEVTLGPIDPGAYRYNFNVDRVSVIDPRNPSTSESNNNAWSMVYIPGADFMELQNVPHGAVASITYYSTALGKWRRMHVYTPPGYEMGQGKYPIFYLLHGAGDCDESWTSVGRAGFILDNLIAAKKAQPMIVVMPAGHTSRTMPQPGAARPARDEFGEDFVSDVMPYVEKHYRALTDRAHMAIAGLSMGGAQTLNISMAHLDRFAYVGVFSSGVFSMGRRNGPPTPPVEWEEQHAAMLDDAALKPGLKVL